MSINYFIKLLFVATADFITTIFCPSCKRKIIAGDVLFIENPTIGDFLLKIPFYKEIIESTSSIQPTILASSKVIKVLMNSYLDSQKYSFCLVDDKKFMYNLIFRMRKCRTFPKYKKLIITSPFRPIPHLILGKYICADEKYVYFGESVHGDATIRLYDKYFKIISNPYRGRKKIDAHIFKHIREIFSSTFDVDIKNPKDKFLKIFGTPNKHKTLNDSYIVLIPDASHNYRLYPIQYWQSILDKLPSKVKIIQLGLRELHLNHPNLTNLVGKTSLEEAIAIIKDSSLVVGNETGLTHLAYLSGIPTVCILGGGHFGRFLPWPEFDDIVKCVYKPMDCFQCGWRCKYVNLRKGEVPPCISQISPDSVLEAIEELDREYKIFP